MRRNMTPLSSTVAVTGVVLAALLAACSSAPRPEPTPPPTSAPPRPAPLPPQGQTQPLAKRSVAQTAREYRRDAAGHLYELNAHRIYRGKLPPLLYAVGVLQVEVDARGNVTGTSWMRAPKHAPEVIAEIERTVRQAAPYPAPVRLGRVTYTDTWLWDKSGKFQLDTLTEGQL